MDDRAGNNRHAKAQKLAFSVVQAGRAGVNAVEAKALRPLGLSYSGSRILSVLWLLGPHEPRELAGVLGISVPSVTSLLNTLERRGLVSRQRSPSDGRLVIVAITDEGLQLAAAAHSESLRVEVVAASALSPEEREQMQDFLNRYLAAIEQNFSDGIDSAREYSERFFPRPVPSLADRYIAATEGKAPHDAEESAAMWAVRHGSTGSADGA